MGKKSRKTKKKLAIRPGKIILIRCEVKEVHIVEKGVFYEVKEVPGIWIGEEAIVQETTKISHG